MRLDKQYEKAVGSIRKDAMEMITGIKEMYSVYCPDSEAVTTFAAEAEKAETIEELLAAVDRIDLEVFPSEMRNVLKVSTRLFYHYLQAELVKGKMICRIYQTVC